MQVEAIQRLEYEMNFRIKDPISRNIYIGLPKVIFKSDAKNVVDAVLTPCIDLSEFFLSVLLGSNRRRRLIV